MARDLKKIQKEKQLLRDAVINTKSIKTLDGQQPDVDLSLLTELGLKMNFSDNSVYEKSKKQILKEGQLTERAERTFRYMNLYDLVDRALRLTEGISDAKIIKKNLNIVLKQINNKI